MKTLTVKKPWGKFDQFTHNELGTVKVISINPNSELSLQYHHNRSEFWRILSGHPTVTIGEKEIKASPGDEFAIAKKEKHRIYAKDDAVEFLEISSGNFNEEDIVRIKDKYGRA